MKAKNDLIMHNKIFALIGVTTAAILTVPLIAMQFSDQVNWSLGDFLIIGVLIVTIASAYVLVARQFRAQRQRIIAAFIFLGLLIWLWAELAVGIFTNWGS